MSHEPRVPSPEFDLKKRPIVPARQPVEATNSLDVATSMDGQSSQKDPSAKENA